MDRSLTTGVSAAGSFALLQHLLAAAEPKADWTAICPSQAGVHWPSLVAGIFVGCFLFASVQLFITARWILVTLVEGYLASRFENSSRRPYYKFLDGSSK